MVRSCWGSELSADLSMSWTAASLSGMGNWPCFLSFGLYAPTLQSMAMIGRFMVLAMSVS